MIESLLYSIHVANIYIVTIFFVSPKVDKFPNLVPIVQDFVQSRGLGAEKHPGGEDVGSVGVSLGEIQRHVKAEIPELADAGISISTIARLFPAPNKARSAGRLYKALIPTRGGRIQSNTKSKENIDTSKPC